MRVLYLHQYFTIPGGSGGTRSYEFARRLIARGHEVRMITSSAMLPPEYHGPATFRREVIAGIPCVVIHVPYSNAMPFPSRIRAFVRFALLSCRAALQEEADVVFATSTPLTIAVPALLVRLFRRTPMVFEVRDLWPDVPIAIGALRNPIARRLARGLERLTYRGSVKIIALSPGMAAGVVRNGGESGKVEVIPNSCDIDLFDVPESRGREMRAALGIGEDAPLLLYAGTFGKANGVGYLVDVAAAMKRIRPEVRFVLVGTGAERQAVEERARQLAVLGENLFIRDPLPKAKIPDLFSAATVTACTFIPIPELRDNSANKFFDSLAAGRPVAINYGGWQADLLRQTGAGIVLPEEDIPAAAARLAEFLDDREAVKRAGKAARKLAHERFSREHAAQRFEAVLLSAAMGGRKEVSPNK